MAKSTALSQDNEKWDVQQYLNFLENSVKLTTQKEIRKIICKKNLDEGKLKKKRWNRKHPIPLLSSTFWFCFFELSIKLDPIKKCLLILKTLIYQIVQEIISIKLSSSNHYFLRLPPFVQQNSILNIQYRVPVEYIHHNMNIRNW